VTLPGGGEVVLVTGASGAGKSTLLRHLVGRARSEGRGVVDLAEVTVPDCPVIDGLGVGLEEALSVLSLAGLAEAHVYVRRSGELSEGQRWRLKLAVALVRVAKERGDVVLVADEFGAVLDRVTAMVVARSVRRAVGKKEYARVGVIVATSHDDLETALDPDRLVECDFGECREVTRRRPAPA
jgi:ABC-type ATPase with predicted acetyltransferase domain